MHLVRCPLTTVDPALLEVAVWVDRQKLARRLWRGVAEDGTDFGFELEAPLRDGDVVHAGAARRYVIRQAAEPLLEIPLDGTPEQAAVLGWAVGNMHFVIQTLDGCIRAPDDSGLRQSLDRIGVSYRVTSGVFQPHRFAAVVAHSHAPAGDHPFLRPPTHGR